MTQRSEDITTNLAHRAALDAYSVANKALHEARIAQLAAAAAIAFSLGIAIGLWHW